MYVGDHGTSNSREDEALMLSNNGCVDIQPHRAWKHCGTGSGKKPAPSAVAQPQCETTVAAAAVLRPVTDQRSATGRVYKPKKPHNLVTHAMVVDTIAMCALDRLIQPWEALDATGVLVHASVIAIQRRTTALQYGKIIDTLSRLLSQNALHSLDSTVDCRLPCEQDRQAPLVITPGIRDIPFYQDVVRAASVVMHISQSGFDTKAATLFHLPHVYTAFKSMVDAIRRDIKARAGFEASNKAHFGEKSYEKLERQIIALLLHDLGYTWKSPKDFRRLRARWDRALRSGENLSILIEAFSPGVLKALHGWRWPTTLQQITPSILRAVAIHVDQRYPEIRAKYSLSRHTPTARSLPEAASADIAARLAQSRKLHQLGSGEGVSGKQQTEDIEMTLRVLIESKSMRGAPHLACAETTSVKKSRVPERVDGHMYIGPDRESIHEAEVDLASNTTASSLQSSASPSGRLSQAPPESQDSAVYQFRHGRMVAVPSSTVEAAVALLDLRQSIIVF